MSPIPDFIGAKDGGSGGRDSWNYKTWKAPVKSSLPTNQKKLKIQK